MEHVDVHRKKRKPGGGGSIPHGPKGRKGPLPSRREGREGGSIWRWGQRDSRDPDQIGLYRPWQ